jgi:hypothetical protein
MPFISPSNHQLFCDKLKEEIDRLELYSSENEVLFERLVFIKQDRNSLIEIASEYQKRLQELRAIIQRYSNIEKRARANLRHEKLSLRKNCKANESDNKRSFHSTTL